MSSTNPSPGVHVSPRGKITKHGAIYRVGMDLVIHALKVINALPADAWCEQAPTAPAEIHLKVRHDSLPLVREGEPYPERVATEGDPSGWPM